MADAWARRERKIKMRRAIKDQGHLDQQRYDAFAAEMELENEEM